MEEPSLREMADYMESNREELFDKLTPPPSGGSSNKQVTLLVYRDGDQLNFFRVVDRGDGTLTPFTESLSGSACNLRDDDDDYDEEYITSTSQHHQQPGGRTSRSPGKQNLSVAQMVENNITAIKMKKLRAQMVNSQQAAAGASTSKSNTNIGLVESKPIQPSKPKTTKPPTSARLRDSKLRRELMEKLNLHDDDDEEIETKHNKPLTVVSEPNVSEIIKKHGALKDMDAVTSKDSDGVGPSSISSPPTELKPVGVGASNNTDNIVGPKKITKAEMLRARFKRLKNIRENMDDDGNKVDTVAAPSLLSNTATDKPDIAEDDSDDITTTSSTLSASQKQPEADKRSVKEKEADTPKKGDIEAADPSSSGRFSPRTRRLLNALEHNTN